MNRIKEKGSKINVFNNSINDLKNLHRELKQFIDTEFYCVKLDLREIIESTKEKILMKYLRIIMI